MATSAAKIKSSVNNENSICAVHVSRSELEMNEKFLNYLNEILGAKLEVLFFEK